MRDRQPTKTTAAALAFISAPVNTNTLAPDRIKASFSLYL